MKNLNLIKDFNNGISLCYIGFSNFPSIIVNIEKINNSFKILCENSSTFFIVSDEKIFYTNTIK